MFRLLPPTLLGFSLLLPACGEASPPSSPPATPSGAERSKPTPVRVDLAAIQEQLAARADGPLLVNFWATWCAPCVAELPELVEVAHEFEPQGLKLVTINYDLMVPGVDAPSVLPMLEKFQKERDLPFPVLVFDGDDYDGINAALDLPGPIPVTLAFDATGQEVGRTEESADAAEFRRLARLALGLPPTDNPRPR